uniref:Lipocalin/cytosolic fatty-acid binding domain-containing protein n=1 Tax=Neogobius melanostomus TaxID=47308 RepID=A0A8C6SSY7_9GOBI
MLRGFSLMLCLIGAWSTYGASPFITQDNFTLGQFLGRWFEVAVASTCPHFMQRKMRNSAIVVLDLQHSAPVGNITVTATSLSTSCDASTVLQLWGLLVPLQCPRRRNVNVSCKTTSTNYSLTETPGRFFYHVPKFDADVDVFVADTNYVEYALMVLVSTERSAGNETLIVKLYSRSRDASETIKENFKTLVRRQGINDKAIIFNWDRGHCEQLTTDTAHT